MNSDIDPGDTFDRRQGDRGRVPGRLRRPGPARRRGEPGQAPRRRRRRRVRPGVLRGRQAGRRDLPRAVDARRGRRRARPHADLVAEPADRHPQRRRQRGSTRRSSSTRASSPAASPTTCRRSARRSSRSSPRASTRLRRREPRVGRDALTDPLGSPPAPGSTNRWRWVPGLKTESCVRWRDKASARVREADRTPLPGAAQHLQAGSEGQRSGGRRSAAGSARRDAGPRAAARTTSASVRG